MPTKLTLFAAMLIASVAAAQTTPPVRNLSEARSGTYVTERNHTRIVWNVSHHGYSTLSAIIPGVSGTLAFDAADVTRSQLDVTVNMDSVGTLIPPFDETVKGERFFNTAKFPTSTFKSTNIEKTGSNTLRVSGDLTFMGVTRPAILEAIFHQAGVQGGLYRLGFDGRMVIARSDFGAARSTIGDQVTLQIEAEFLLRDVAG